MDTHAIYEIHITIGPYNPDDKVISIFENVCSENKMKPIRVGILYRDGFKRVLQSSKYITSNLIEAHKLCTECSNLFKLAGLEVIREKIEAIASYFPKLSGDLYYENHIVISVNSNYLINGNFIETEDIKLADRLNKRFNKSLDLNVPLSFNLKYSDKDQCFITVRGYNTRKECNDEYIEVCLEVIRENGFRLIKVIREAVIYDSNNSIDAEEK